MGFSFETVFATIETAARSPKASVARHGEGREFACLG
jgi:hypothetical protein